MQDERPRPDRLANLVHWTLLTGVLASAVTLLAGLVLSRGAPDSAAEPVKQFGELLARATARDGRAVLDVGLLLLMFTPACRVVVLAVGWSVRREWKMALVALIVAALLVFSVTLGVG